MCGRAAECGGIRIGDAHARVVEMCERLATTRAAHLANNCLQTLIAFSACKRLRHLTLDGNDAIRLDGLSLARGSRCCV